VTDLRPEIGALAKALAQKTVREGILIAERLPSRPWARLARSTRGFAAVLPAISGPARPDIVYEQLRVCFNIECTLESGGHVRDERLVIIECLAADPQVQAAFLDVVAVLLPSDEHASGADLQRAVTSLADLFRALLVAGPKSVLGLWGELFAMWQAVDPAAAAAAWHTTPHDRYDFAAGGLRVEVKTTTGVRAHTFSLEQLMPPAGVRVLVASIITTPSPSGPSVDELLQTVAAQVSDDTRSRLVETAMRSLGSGWQQGCAARFDADLASAALRWFDGQVVPRVADPPLEVREVRFKSDLQTCDSLDESALSAAGPLGNAMRSRFAS
jgi:hypothetical protein